MTPEELRRRQQDGAAQSRARLAEKVAAKKAKAKPRDRARATRRLPPPDDGTNEFIPTADQRELVKLCSGIGMTQMQTCLLIINPHTERPISIHTLEECFPIEMETGKAQVLAKVAGTLVSIATDKNHKSCVQAGMFYLRTQAKWREPDPALTELRRLQEELERQTEDDEPIVVTLVLEEPKEVD